VAWLTQAQHAMSTLWKDILNVSELLSYLLLIVYSLLDILFVMKSARKQK